MAEPQPKNDGDEVSRVRAQLALGLSAGKLRSFLARPRRQLMAVELNSYGLKCVVRSREGAGFTLREPHQFSVPLEHHQDRAVRARLLGERLRTLLRVNGRREFLCVLPSSRVRTTIVDLPGLSLDDTLGALALKALKLIGGSVAGWHVHATRLDAATAKEASLQHFLITAHETAEMEELAQIFRFAEALPIAMTTSAAAYQRLMPHVVGAEAAPGTETPAAEADDTPIWAVVEMHRYNTGMHIYRNGSLVYTRVVQFGGDDLTKALMDTVATREGFIELTFEQAERLKEAVGLPGPGDDAPIAGSPLLPEQLRMMYEPKLNMLVYELRSAIRHYQQLSGHRQLNRLLMTGGSSRMKGLDQHLFRSFKIHPQQFNTADLPFGLDAPEDQRAAMIVAEAPVLAGALHEAGPTQDILPNEMHFERCLRSPFRIAICALVAMAIVLGGLAWRTRSAASEGREAAAAIGAPTRQAQEVTALIRERSEIEAVIARLKKELGFAAPMAGVLADIARRMPAEVSVTQLRLSGNAVQATLHASGAVASAQGVTRTPLALLAETFEASPFARTFVVKNLTRRAAEAARCDFDLECSLFLRDIGDLR